MNISVYNEASWLCPLPKHVLQALLLTMYAPEMVSMADGVSDEDVLDAGTHLQLYVVRDASISQINSAYMQGHGPTNILSFPAVEKVYVSSAAQYGALHGLTSRAQQPDMLVLSVDTLHRECLLYGQPLLEHTVRLLAHGLGHILGYDHGEEMYALCAYMEERGRSFLALS